MTHFYLHINRHSSFASFAIGSIVLLLVLIIVPHLLPNNAELLQTPIAPGIMLVWLITAGVYKLTRTTSVYGWIVLTLATIILSVGIILNLNYFSAIEASQIANGVYDNNGLLNPDSLKYWLDGTFHYTNGEEGCETSTHQQGYGLMLSWLWILTGKSLFASLSLNALFILLTIILSGVICRRFIGENKHSSVIAMALTASICYFLNSGTLLLKEAPLSFAMALAILGISKLCIKPTSTKSDALLWVSLVGGIIFTAFIRLNFVIYLLLATIMFYRRKTTSLHEWTFIASLCIVVWVGAKILILNIGESSSDIGIVTGYGLNNSFFFDSPQHSTFNSIFEGYFDFPIWKKVLLLPITVVVQFLIPFPWDFASYSVYGPTLVYARIAYPWYAIGGIILYYICIGRRGSPISLMRLTIWAMIVWIIPAYLFAGTVSRYTLPIIPMLIPAATYAVIHLRKMKSFKLWMAIYSIILIVGLVSAYNIQHVVIK